jgi:hypothetical protein
MPTSTNPSPGPPASLAAALAELQTQLPHIAKDSKAAIPNRPAHSYAGLGNLSHELLPLMGKLGLSFSAKPTVRKGQFGLRYKLRLAGTGEADKGFWPLPTGAPQATGSALTYYRRYILQCLTGAVADDDDDGQAAEDAPRRTPTDAELKGPDLTAHNRLRRAGAPTVKDIQDGKLQRGITTDPGPDEFSSVDSNGERHPPGDLTGTYPPGQRQLGAIQAHFRRLGFEDHERDERLAITARIAGAGDIGSSKDLTQDQVKAALKVLEKCRDRPMLTAAVIAMAESEDAGA